MKIFESRGVCVLGVLGGFRPKIEREIESEESEVGESEGVW